VWSAAVDGPVNCGFTIAIFVTAIAAIIGIVTRRGVVARLAHVAPGMLTAIGVLGTFVGILDGLLQFNVADISGSVPGLLDGMKTAFVTSVLGTGTGLVVKFAAAMSAKPENTAGPKDVEDVVTLLDSIRQETTTSRLELVSALDRMRTALSGDSESSLVTQIQRLRTDVTDDIKASRQSNEGKIASIADEIRKISKNLAEDTTEVFVQALERAIRDFNQRITEQFGENFKHLNTAVGRLLEWQQTYREQMQANGEALREGAAGIQAVRGGMEAIASKADSLVSAAAAMHSLLDGIGKTRSELDARLQAFSVVRPVVETADCVG
jgi:predicted  nucleic acid-binding Zn-ribbon protein